MKKLFSIIWLIPFCIGMVTAQDMYIWCPDDHNPDPQPELLSGDKVELIIIDSRTISSKAHVKCTFEDFSASMISSMKSAFPNALIETKEVNTKNPGMGKIQIQIDVLEYAANFRLGSWFGNTSYGITIKDFRGEEIREYQTTISNESSSPNFIGLATARNSLKRSYIKSTEELFRFISDKLQ